MAKKPKPPLKPKPTKGVASPIPPKRSGLTESGHSAPQLQKPAGEREQDRVRRYVMSNGPVPRPLHSEEVANNVGETNHK